MTHPSFKISNASPAQSQPVHQRDYIRADLALTFPKGGEFKTKNEKNLHLYYSLSKNTQ